MGEVTTYYTYYEPTPLSLIHICSPYQLFSTSPACGCQKRVLLTIHSPKVKAFLITLSGLLFIHAREFIRQYGWFLLLRNSSLKRLFVSHKSTYVNEFFVFFIQ